MDGQNYWNRMAALRLERRRVLKGMAATSFGLAASGMLAACGGNTNNAANSKAASPANNSAPGTPAAASGTRPAGASPAAAATKSGPPVQRGGELIVRRPSPFTFADPQQSGSGYDPAISQLYASPLVVMDAAAGKIAPNIVQSWEQTDDTTLTFKLRKDIMFTDNTPLNAAAVKFSIERAQSKDFNASSRRYVLPITATEIPDDFTITLKFAAPNAVFLEGLTMNAPDGSGAVVSPAAVQKLGNDAFNLNPVSAGPYTCQSYQRSGETVLVKNPNWPITAPNGDKLPYLDTIRFRVVPENATALSDLQAGNIDLDYVFNPDDVTTVKARPELDFNVHKGALSQAFGMVTNKAPMDNLAFRQALCYAANRDEAAATFGPNGVSTPGKGPLTDLSWAYDSSAPVYTYDAEKAKQLLAQSGLANGAEIKIASSTTSFYGKFAELLQAQLQRVNIKSSVDLMEAVVLTQKFRDQGLYQAGLEYQGGPQGDPYSFFQGKYATDQTPGHVTLPGWDDLLAKALKTLDQTERKKIYAQMQRMDYDGAYRVWLMNSGTVMAFRKKVQGASWLTVGSAVDLRYAWKQK